MRAGLSILATVLVLAGCGDAGSPSNGPGGGLPAPSQTDHVLAIGQEVWVDSLLRLSVTGVSQDSRCALQAMCVWAGDGTVAIAHGVGMEPMYPDTVHTLVEPRSVAFAGYRISLDDFLDHHVTGGRQLATCLRVTGIPFSPRLIRRTVRQEAILDYHVPARPN
jgi:hypothetical protein